jgi:hypothetical protein
MTIDEWILQGRQGREEGIENYICRGKILLAAFACLVTMMKS